MKHLPAAFAVTETLRMSAPEMAERMYVKNPIWVLQIYWEGNWVSRDFAEGQKVASKRKLFLLKSH
jgi:hypothetical protein